MPLVECTPVLLDAKIMLVVKRVWGECYSGWFGRNVCVLFDEDNRGPDGHLYMFADPSGTSLCGVILVGLGGRPLQMGEEHHGA